MLHEISQRKTNTVSYPLYAESKKIQQIREYSKKKKETYLQIQRTYYGYPWGRNGGALQG